jgi:hypothetical protein
VIAFCFVIAAIILVQVFRTITFSPQNSTIPLDVTRTEIMIPGNGFNTKTETIYLSPIQGTVHRIKIPGAVVRVGSPMASVSNSSTTTEIQAQSQGILSYIRDGLEEIFTFENALQKSISYDDIVEPPTKFERVEEGKKVLENEFVCKVVNNDSICYVLLIQTKLASRLEKGTSATFSLTYPASLSVNGTIIENEPYNDELTIVCFSTPYYVETLLNTRKVNGYFSFGYRNAAILPPSAVKEISPNQYALYYLPFDSQTPVYAPVNVEGIQPGTEQYIITEIKSGEKMLPIEDFRGIEIFLDWKNVEKELLTNED